MRNLAYFIIGVITFFIQGQVLPMIMPTNWIPNLVLVWVGIITLIHGRRAGLIIAAIGGIVHDVLISNFFGMHLFPYIILVYVLSLVKSKIYEEQWYVSFILVALSTLVDGILRILMLYMVRVDIMALPYLWHLVLPAMVVNGILGIVLHIILWRLEVREEYMW